MIDWLEIAFWILTPPTAIAYGLMMFNLTAPPRPRKMPVPPPLPAIGDRE